VPSLHTSKGAVVPKLNLGGEKDDESSKMDQESEAKSKRDRRLSGSNRGSIGRKERLRNALTGRSDGSGDGADQPKELPESELIDFLLSYDQTDKYTYQPVKRKIEKEDFMNRSLDGDENDQATSALEGIKNESSNQSGYEGGSNDSPIKGAEEVKMEKSSASSSSDSQYRYVKEVNYLPLDEALKTKLDLNQVTNIYQRFRNINSQPRHMSELYPAPFLLLTKREKRCKDCHKFIIKPNMSPISQEKMKVDQQMLYYVPKIVIYRMGKFTHYKGFEQDIETLIKFTNNLDSQVEVSFSQLSDHFVAPKNQVELPLQKLSTSEESKSTEDTSKQSQDKKALQPGEISKAEKVRVASTLNATPQLPQGVFNLESKISIVSSGDLPNEEKRSREDFLKIVQNPYDADSIYKIVQNSVVIKIAINLKKGFSLETDEAKFGFNMIVS